MKEVNFGDRRPSVGRYAASDASRPKTVDCAFGNAGMLILAAAPRGEE
jgi:hypothetical protein